MNPPAVEETNERNLVVKDDEIGHSALKEFECPICFSYAAPPIMMCQMSHIVCNTCWKKCYNCPTCRAPKSLTRAMTLENLYPLLTFPCKYEGCPFKGNGAFTPIHEQSCMFYPIVCPLDSAFDCAWRGPIGNSRKHLLQNHRANVYFEPIIRLVSKGLIYSDKKHYAVIFCCFGKIFKFTLEYDRSTSPDVQFNMIQIGCRNSKEKFHYTLKFFNTRPHLQGTHGCITTKSIVSKEINDFQSGENGQQSTLINNAKWRLRFHHLVSYCTLGNGDFYYEVVLQKQNCNFQKHPFRRHYTRR